MSTIPDPGTLPGDKPEIPTPTVTRHLLRAREALRLLDDLEEIIPYLETKHEANDALIKRHGNVTVAFIGTAASSVEQSPLLEGFQKFDAADARDTLQYYEAFGPVEDRIMALGNKLHYTRSKKKAEQGRRARQLYGIAKSLGLDPDGAQIGPFVQNLKRDARRGRKRSPETNEAEPRG